MRIFADLRIRESAFFLRLQNHSGSPESALKKADSAGSGSGSTTLLGTVPGDRIGGGPQKAIEEYPMIRIELDGEAHIRDLLYNTTG